MERMYILDELDCANCAMKIEKHVSKIKGVKECSVDFVSKRMLVDMEHEGIEAAIRETVQAVEPDVIMRRRDAKKAKEAKQEEGRKSDHLHEVHEHAHTQGAVIVGKCMLMTMRAAAVHTRLHMHTTITAAAWKDLCRKTACRSTVAITIMKTAPAGMTTLMKHMRIVKFRAQSSCMLKISIVQTVPIKSKRMFAKWRI